MELYKIALTGGPCGGKTTASCLIKEKFSQLGIKVILVPESATELRSSGITPESEGSVYAYQLRQYLLQKTKEDIAGKEALESKKDTVLIVCDRGLADNMAYMSPTDFYKLLVTQNTSLTEMLLAYDAVFHLSTAAKSEKKVYQTCNNPVRKEDKERAKELDDKLIRVWGDHPSLYVIEEKDDFSAKTNELLLKIGEIIGKTPYLHSTKFMIKAPRSFPNEIKNERITTYKIGHDAYVSEIVSDEETEYKESSPYGQAYLTRYQFVQKTGGENKNRKFSSEKKTYLRDDSVWEIETYDHVKDKAVLTVYTQREGAPFSLPDSIEIIQKM